MTATKYYLEGRFTDESGYKRGEFIGKLQNEEDSPKKLVKCFKNPTGQIPLDARKNTVVTLQCFEFDNLQISTAVLINFQLRFEMVKYK